MQIHHRKTSNVDLHKKFISTIIINFIDTYARFLTFDSSPPFGNNFSDSRDTRNLHIIAYAYAIAIFSLLCDVNSWTVVVKRAFHRLKAFNPTKSWKNCDNGKSYSFNFLTTTLKLSSHSNSFSQQCNNTFYAIFMEILQVWIKIKNSNIFRSSSPFFHHF